MMKIRLHSIEASMQPLPVTERQDFISGRISAFTATIYLVIIFLSIQSGAIYFMVNEDTALTKCQQLVSGIFITAC